MIANPDIHIVRTNSSRLAKTDFSHLPFGKTFSDHMLVGEYSAGEWHSFRIIPYGELAHRPSIAGLHYGQAIFEGLKAYKHPDGAVSLFRVDKNAARFARSAGRLCMPEIPVELFIKSIAALVNVDRDWVPARPGHAMYIRPLLYATDEYLGVAPSQTYQYVVLTGPVGPYFSKPLRVKIEVDYTRAAEGGMGYAKAAGNYAGSLLPARKAAEEGFDQLIWTDGQSHQYIEEMGAANVMFVIDGVLVTPSTRDTILDGVTRDTVLTLARDAGVRVDERRVAVAEVIDAITAGRLTDAFGVGTAYTLAPISSISFDRQEYRLPEVGARTFANGILETLDSIRYGRSADIHNWNHLVY